MPVARPAIRIEQSASGWNWELLDADGVLAARGAAQLQEDAMADAWQAARTLSDPAAKAFPDIVVSHRDLADA